MTLAIRLPMSSSSCKIVSTYKVKKSDTNDFSSRLNS